MKFLTLLVVTIGILVVCPNGRSTSHEKRAPFSITLHAVRSTLEPGAPVELRIQLTNTSDHDIDAPTSYDRGFNIGYQCEVRREDGTLLEPRRSDNPISGSSKVRSLKPGEAIEEGTNIGGEYDMTVPGKYTIVLSRAATGDLKDGIVRSNKVVVTVVP